MSEVDDIREWSLDKKINLKLSPDVNTRGEVNSRVGNAAKECDEPSNTEKNVMTRSPTKKSNPFFSVKRKKHVFGCRASESPKSVTK